MNILHSIDTAGPGGAETVYRDLVIGMSSSEKVSSYPVLPYKGWLYDELVAVGEPPAVVPVKGAFNVKYLWSLVRLIRKNHIDLIHSHLIGSNVYCSMAGLLTCTPVIATFHGFVDSDKKDSLRWLKFAIINKGCKAVVFVSSHLKDFFVKEFGVDPDICNVIYNGIDIKCFKPGRSNSLRVELGLEREDILVGSIGNIRPAKGYDILLKVAALVKEKNKKIKFIIAGQGQGSLFDNLQRFRKKMDLEDTVFFLGYRENAVELLHNFDLFLLTSTSEGFSISTVEALACGVPIVATKCGGPEEIIGSDRISKLVANGSVEALKDAILEIRFDPSQENILQSFNKQTERWSLSFMLDAYMRLYKSIV